MAYAEALAVQRNFNRVVGTGDADEVILTVEHDPVITLSQRRGVRDHLLADDAELARLGIDVQDTDRGGDITYHGPGQLVCYPILRLDRHGLNLSRYMRLLERVVIDTVAAFGVEAVTEPGATGVWVGGVPGRWPLATGWTQAGDAVLGQRPAASGQRPATAKLCALGVRIRKHTTMHGLALNVTTDPAHFATIDPCGLGNRPVTSLQQLLSERCPSIDTVRARLVKRLTASIRAPSVSDGSAGRALPTGR